MSINVDDLFCSFLLINVFLFFFFFGRFQLNSLDLKLDDEDGDNEWRSRLHELDELERMNLEEDRQSLREKSASVDGASTVPRSPISMATVHMLSAIPISDRPPAKLTASAMIENLTTQFGWKAATA